MNASMQHRLSNELSREMERFFASRGSSFSPARTATGRNEDTQSGGAQSWSPAVDVVETETEIVLHAELPGMKKEEIELQLSGDTLTIRGERACVQGKSGENFHRIERRYGKFARTFQIETSIDAEKVAAAYDDGVLTVRLPKAASARPRQIEISTK
ncbi:MAG TPA: Hsp20/alpha crystallin family protein [Abditibacteriaceae bacterium]|jgi:HSP20 family protein